MKSNYQLSKPERKRLESVKSSNRLKRCSTNITHWELLLLIYELDGDPQYGINDYIDALTTLRATRLTIQNFIKDRIEDGDFEVAPSIKRSKKTLVLSDELRVELEKYLVDNALNLKS